MPKIKFTEEMVGKVSHNKSYPWKTKRVKHYYTDGIIDRIPKEQELTLKEIKAQMQANNGTNIVNDRTLDINIDADIIRANFAPFINK